VRRPLLFLSLVCSCVPAPPRPVVEVPADDLLRPGASWTFADPGGAATRCAWATTASEWRRLRAELGLAAAALPEPPCAFAGERVVVVWLRGPGLQPQVQVRVGTEEGVDVVTLVPASGRGQPEATVVHVFVAPERPGPLAVVAVSSEGVVAQERTLAVLPRN
jgi:hypothetical protein